MSKTSKEYIECRLYILGDERVGKKSFVQKILNLPSTGIIHDIESENEYKNLLDKYKSDVEEEKIFQQQQEALLESLNKEKNSNKAKEVTSKFTSTHSLFKIDEEKTLRRNKSNLTKNEKTNKNITTTGKNVQGNNINDSSFIGKKYDKKKILREPVPEYPAKLFSVNLDKIVIKIFCIPKAEKRPPDFIPRDEDEEYELEKEHNISFDGIKNDLSIKLSLKDTCISQDKLSGYNTSIFTLFIFLYDMSDFYSFESLILYYSKIAKLFNFRDEQNFKACIIGNKKDKKVKLENEQLTVFNEFLKKTNLKKYEISTKPYFLFDKFFLDFFFEMFSQYEQNETEPNNKLLLNADFIEGFNKVVKSRPNFAKGKRSDLVHSEQVPGPEYNLNLYSFNTIEEIKQVFTDKKSRFNKKIFVNKRGPIIHEEKTINIVDKKTEKNLFNMEIKGGLYNKPINGYSFGIVKGKLNLLQQRKDLRNQRTIDFNDNIIIDRYNNKMPIYKQSMKQSRDEEYFENAKKKKYLYKKDMIEERQLKMSRILEIHNENLKKIEEEKKIKNEKLLLQKSNSASNLLLSSINSHDENYSKEKEKKILKERYAQAIYGRNHINLEKYHKKLSKIRLLSSMKAEPEPYLIDIRENILNPAKGRKILGKYKISEKQEEYPKYRVLEDDFDKIVEQEKKKMLNIKKNEDKNNEENNKKLLREEKLKQNEMINLINLEKKEEKRNKWIQNKSETNLLKKKHLKEIRKEKLLRHQKLYEEEELKLKIISDLRRDISIQKGYGDPTIISPINYSLVEESPPKYTIKGRYVSHESNNEELKNLVLGINNIETSKKIKEAQKNQPLPNYNYIKPKLPSIIFNRAERFPRYKPASEDSVVLFEDGVFLQKEHKDFAKKEPMESKSQRGRIESAYVKSPSPADYVIKSGFDDIAEKGEMINKIRTKIRLDKANSKDKDKDKNINKSKDKENKSFDKDKSIDLNLK